MARNGALQYAVISPELREINLPLYEDFRWVTGTSSPWVESFEIVSEREISGGGMGIRGGVRHRHIYRACRCECGKSISQ